MAAAALTVAGAVIGAGCQQGGGSGDTDEGTLSTRDPQKVEAMQQGTVDVGTPADYPHDGAYANYVKPARVIVVRQGGRLSAVSSVCTHRSCNLKPVEDDLRCPCHGSRYDLSGHVFKGPSTRDLPHYAIAVGPNGRLTVDRSRKLPASDPAASVSATG